MGCCAVGSPALPVPLRGRAGWLVQPMLLCSPHLPAPWGNSCSVWAVIAEGAGSFAVQGGEVAWGTCTRTLFIPPPSGVQCWTQTPR